jgi:hypothetical protein
VSDIQIGALYQDLATGAICEVDDFMNARVTLHVTDAPRDKLKLAAESFLKDYARANSEQGRRV